MHQKAKQYINQLQLVKHPEGGYFREVYRSGELILPEHLPARYKSSRNFSSSIYFLLEGKQFSAFHLLQSDELWHFYDGCPVILYIINQKGELTIKKLGKKNLTYYEYDGMTHGPETEGECKRFYGDLMVWLKGLEDYK